MSYLYSNVDRKNFSWIAKDDTCATLQNITLTQGSMRGLTTFEMNLRYPISVIAGENGCGKSTLLAIASCAYHNRKNGYKPTGRMSAYYTFSDFFIQSREELPPEGIIINYLILHNNWRGGESGAGWQSRQKKRGGKWNNYDKRVSRNVVYFGIQRAVPHNERSTHKSYRSHFTVDSIDEEYRTEICEIAGRILGKTYGRFELRKHSKYSLPLVESKGVRYSGFNMGAGESAVFEILSALFESGRGSLLIIDEIELGLHEGAQEKFVDELKQLCAKRHCQIICSTHSYTILKKLPPEARFFLEKRGRNTEIITEINPDYACRKLSSTSGGELDVFVEDQVAESIIQRGLPYSIRERINVIAIGSSTAILRLLASRYLEKKDGLICILDGDMHGKHQKNIRDVRNFVEGNFRSSENEMTDWTKNRIAYLPSNEIPEKWLIGACMEIKNKAYLERTWQVYEPNRIDNLLESALNRQNHFELYYLEKEIQCSRNQIINDMVSFVTQNKKTTFEEVKKSINILLRE